MEKKNNFTTKNALLSLCVLITIVLSISYVSSHPPLPTEFYGSIIVFNANATSGKITAYAGSTLCGSFDIVNTGYYGILSCMGNDNETSSVEGGSQNDVITFRYNGNPATEYGNNTFNATNFLTVDLVYPEVFCGDGFCDLRENCGVCPTDCNSCNMTNQTTNSTGNSSSNQSGSGGGSGGSGGGGGSGSGAGAGGGGGFTTGPAVGGEIPQTCAEDWECINWTECTPIGVKTRKCYDKNDCQTYSKKPLEVQECDYNGTCFDAIINCHDDLCEDGLDCGGPCERKCSNAEQPFQNITIKPPKLKFPTEICEKQVDISNPSIWIFILIILLCYIGRYLYTEYLIRELRKNEKLTPLKRSIKITSAKRKTMLFSVTLVFLTLASLLYAYFFMLCPNSFFDFSWILLLLLVLIPLIIHSVMKNYEYNEEEHYAKDKKLEDTHYQNIVTMIDLENDMLVDEENAIATKLYDLSKNPEFKELLEKYPVMKMLYKDLVELTSQYKHKKNPYELERKFCDELSDMENNAELKKGLESNPELKNIHERLKKIYSEYEEKQKLYNKLDELEKSESKKSEKGTDKKEDKKNDPKDKK